MAGWLETLEEDQVRRQGNIASGQQTTSNIGGFLQDSAGKAGDWLEELALMGFDVASMSPAEQAQAAAEVGIETSVGFFNAAGSGLAGLGVLATGGDLDSAVDTIQGGMQNSPFQYQSESRPGQALSGLLAKAEEPLEYGAKQAGRGMLSATDSPAAAAGLETALTAGLIGVPSGAGLAAIMNRGNMGSEGSLGPAPQTGAIGDFEPSMIVTPTNEATQVSTRMPSQKGKNPEDPYGSLLLSDMEAAQRSPDLLEKNINLMRDYPGMGRLSANAKPEMVMNEFHEMVRDNLLEVHDRTPPGMREAARQWYEGANKIRGGLAREYDMPPEAVSGIMASLSPQKEWNTNVSLAERMIDVYKNELHTVTSADMLAKGRSMTTKNSQKKIVRVFSDETLAGFEGQTLAGINDPKEKAKWIRLFDETNNTKSFDVWSPDGTRAGRALTAKGDEKKAAWGSFSEMEKAVRILENPYDIDNISNHLGKQHKVRNFYNNIENPYSDVPFYTSDTHNVAASTGMPLSGNDAMVGQSFGSAKGTGNSTVTGMKGTYPGYLEGGGAAARERGLQPREMQSITWESIRNMFTDTFKRNPANREQVTAVWKDFDKRRITRQEAWDRLEEITGGIKSPAWLEP